MVNALQIINPIIFSLVVVFSYLSSNGSLGGADQKEISDQNPTLITPAAAAFSIWGFIYAGMGGFAIYSALDEGVPSSKNNELVYSHTKGIGYLFAAASAGNALWVFIWGFNEDWSFIVDWFVIVSVFIFAYTQYIRSQKIRLTDGFNTWEHVIVPFAVSIHAGWLLAASALGTIIALSKFDLTPVDTEERALFVLGILFGVYSGTMWQYKDPFFALVGTWAFAWIGEK